MKALAFDHICIAVNDLDQAMAQYEDLLGLELAGIYEAPSESIRVARYYLKDVALELMEPLTPDCEVGRFLETRGEGVFLISYLVDDVAEGLAELKAKGHRTIDQEPRELLGNKYAFINPPSETCGVLTEIIEGGFHPTDNDPAAD